LTVSQILVIWICLLAAALGLAGLLLRGNARFCRVFTCYLGVMVVIETAVTIWPGVFWTWRFWLLKQVAYDMLKIATALELAYWIFLGFPGAGRVARGVVFLFLGATLVAVLAMPATPATTEFTLASLRARLEVGTAWTFTALAALVRWYRIPLHPMHRAIIFGFVSYLMVFSTALKLAADTGLMKYLAVAQPPAYLAVCCLWAWAAWQREAVSDVNVDIVAQLQPWRLVRS
jgi:hypothetical protein